MAIYVYNTNTGALVSWCPSDDDPVADDATLAAAGLTKVTGLAALDGSHAWDAATKTVVAASPASVSKPCGTGPWIMRFTPAEFAAISASTDVTVQQFMYALNHTTQLDLADPLIVQGVDYLVSVNLLQQSRVAAIMAV